MDAGIVYLYIQNDINAKLAHIYSSNYTHIGIYYNESDNILHSKCLFISYFDYISMSETFSNIYIFKDLINNNKSIYKLSISSLIKNIKQRNIKEKIYIILKHFIYHKLKHSINDIHELLNDIKYRYKEITKYDIDINKLLINPKILFSNNNNIFFENTNTNTINSNIIKSIYDINYSDFILLKTLLIHYHNIKKFIDNGFINSNFKYDEYKKLHNNFININTKILNKYQLYPNFNNLYYLIHNKLEKNNNKIIYIDYDNDNYKFDAIKKILYNIYEHLYKISNNIKNNEIINININSIIKSFNKLINILNPELITIDINEFNGSMNSILDNNNNNIQNNIKIKLNNNNKIILSVLNPNLSIFNIDELEEILISLDPIADGNSSFDLLRTNIVNEIIKNENKNDINI